MLPFPSCVGSEAVRVGELLETTPAVSAGHSDVGQVSHAPGSNDERIKEVFLRTAYSTQLALHGMADNKSRMLLHLNGILLSITFAMKAQFGADQIWTVLTLVSFSGISVILALIAVRPPDAKQNAGFFGNSLMSERDGEQHAQSTAPATFADDGRTGVHSLDQDLVLGLQGLTNALARKHSVLRLAYGVSACGALATGLLFLGTIATTTGW